MADTVGTPQEGQEFVLKLGAAKVMGCISHNIDFSAEEKDSTTMDSDPGWSQSKSGKKSWGAAADVQVQKGASYNAKQVVDAFISGAEADLYFGGLEVGDLYFSGKVWVSGGSINTNGNGENISMSVNLKGTNALSTNEVV